MVLVSSSQRIVASVLGAIGVVLWATETTLITYTTAIPPLQTVALAFMFAFLMSPLAWRITGADPMAAFRHPVYVWAIMVGSLVGYHACIYYATQKAPPAAAALLHGTTPLMIVFGSALLPGERLRWWHVAGVVVGLCGIILLIDHGADHSHDSINAIFYLSLVGIAAALWGLYSVVSRSLSDIPSSAMGAFYGASAIIAAIGHLFFEGWVQPQWSEWFAIAALGIFPMGLAIYLWDYGMKRGDIQALGAFSYVEPFIGAILVAAFTSATLEWNMVWSGSLVVTGAILASKSLWPTRKKAHAMTHDIFRAGTFNSMISKISFRDGALEKLAYFDPLTGLPNRTYFQRQIDETLAKSEGEEITAALLFLDLDDFKQINDAFGHTIGDGLLMCVAALLKQEVTGDIKLARLGGDEFIVIIENISSENEAQEKIAPFIAALYQPIDILEHKIYVSTSVGVTMIPRDGKSSGELMRRADLALYSAKRQGHGFVHFFQPAMDAVVQENTEIAQGLRRAIANDEFETHYQPQVDLLTGKVYGFECLIRWKDLQRGYIPPAKFIPIAESAGLISEIGNWILRDSCLQARAWLKEGHTPREISVNVSAAQILRADFLRDVSTVLEETKLPPHLLCLELTESLFIGKSVEKVSQMLDDLRDLGVLLALDNFGTGYSSLSYLKKLPFDKLKIDLSFVSGIENDVAKRNILKGIIMLAHTLGMQVVAVGAETQGEVAMLGDLEVDCVQGYALSRPVPANKAIAATQIIVEEFPVKYRAGVTNARRRSKASVILALAR